MAVLEGDQTFRWCQEGKQVKDFNAWASYFQSRLLFLLRGSLACMPDLHSSLFKVTYTQNTFNSDGEEQMGVHHRMTKNLTSRSRKWKFCSESVHLTEQSVVAVEAPVALNPGSPQAIKLGNVFQTLKPQGSDPAVTLALREVYWSCFPSSKEQS